jgi:hypothetical protein
MRIVWGFLLVLGMGWQAAAAGFDPIPTADLSKLKPADFSDDELDLPFYLAHLRELADSVVASGPDRGFIDIAVWRPASGDKPYNARIMENILSLAYFYTTQRPWNVYYGSKPLRQRLEAALEFWCRIQSPEGKFSEYEPQGWNLAATAFATKFMGRALILLRAGPPIDGALLARVEAADRKTIQIGLTDPGLWEHGRQYANQYTNLWAGCLEYLHVLPDGALEQSFWKRVADGLKEFQSPAGFFYESGGADFGYNSDTHQHNLEVAYQWTRGTARARAFVEHDRRWFEWLSWNALPAVEGDGWVLNRGIETRQKHAFFEELTTPLAEQIPAARAYAIDTEEHAKQIRSKRAELEKSWPRVAPLKVGEFWAWSPYVFLHRDQFHWYPSPAERAEARRKLPFAASERFVHQLKDDRNPLVFTYIRRPRYYAAFNSGKHLTAQQRYGLGLVWTPSAGAVLQSQTGTDGAAWGTSTEGHPGVWESGDVDATFSDNDATARYAVGRGEKTVRFLEDRIEVTVRAPGRLTETLPLLGTGGMEVLYGAEVSAIAIPQETSVGNKRLRVVRLSGENELSYTLMFQQ